MMKNPVDVLCWKETPDPKWRSAGIFIEAGQLLAVTVLPGASVLVFFRDEKGRKLRREADGGFVVDDAAEPEMIGGAATPRERSPLKLVK